MMRLPSFVVPCEHETIHSTVARYVARHPGSFTSHLRLLGIEPSAAHGFMPSGALGLAGLVPEGHPWYENPARILEKHSLVPVFSSFFTKEKREKLYANILSRTSNYARALLGSLPSDGLRTENYKFCRHCALDDINGASGWVGGVPASYRHHQPSFVRFCVRHEEPLISGCMSCFTSAKAGSRWVIAGDCKCQGAYFSWEDWSSKDAEPWLWLARQVHTLMINPPPPEVHLASNLSAVFRERHSSPFGLNSKSIWDALEAKFGLDMFNQLQLHAPGTSRNCYWPQSSVGRSKLAEGRGLLLRLLLLAGTVVDSVEQLYRVEVRSKSPPARSSGYTNIRAARSAGIGADALQAALQNHKGSILAAANSVGMWYYPFVGALIAHGIQVNLPSKYQRTLGAETLDKIRSEISQGIAKKETAKRFGITLNVMDRIQLDRPALAEEHRLAVINRVRDAHRLGFLAFRDANPNATRDQIAQNKGVQWLRNFDAKWLSSAWPTKVMGKYRVTPRRDWAGEDRKLAKLALAHIAEELSSGVRPVRMSKMSFLRKFRVLPPNLKKLPHLAMVLAYAAEEIQTHRERVLKWSVAQCRDLDVSLTVRMLCKISRTNSKYLRANAEFIVREAIRMGVPIGDKSYFAVVASAATTEHS